MELLLNALLVGMTLPYSSSFPAQSDEKREECGRVGETIKHLLELNIKPKDIVTRKVFSITLF